MTGSPHNLIVKREEESSCQTRLSCSQKMSGVLGRQKLMSPIQAALDKTRSGSGMLSLLGPDLLLGNINIFESPVLVCQS